LVWLVSPISFASCSMYLSSRLPANVEKMNNDLIGP
jgi:hypothetical protein